MKNNTNTFNGATTVTYPHNPQMIPDTINFCPYCGKQINLEENAHYCKFCGKEIPRTTTNGIFIYHWNYTDGTPSYPRDGIIKPNITC